MINSLFLTGKTSPSSYLLGPIRNAAVVPYEDTFLIVGGQTRFSASDKVWRYLKWDEWQEMGDLKLRDPRYWHTAILVSPDLFPTC